jgi:hypothetical protein
MKPKPTKSSLVQAIRAASEARAQLEDRLSGKPASNNTSKPDIDPRYDDLTVNLSIKVSKRQRLHWLVEAKQAGTSLTEAIVTALTARFGDPTNG